MTALIVVLVIVVVLAVVAAAAWSVRVRRRRAALQAGFGPEYDRTVASSEKRRSAERELTARQQEHEALTLRPLSSAARARYQERWTEIQTKFVDAPALALNEADSLVTQLLADRGYPTDGFEEKARLLSVEHAHVIEDYRGAHAVEVDNRAGNADTEAVRNAMLAFRRVFEDVMGESAPTTPGSATVYPSDVEPTSADNPAPSRSVT